MPITAAKTFEDPSITDPAGRERLFGQHDHVGRYGPDYEARLNEAGFEVQKYSAVDVVGAQNLKRMGIVADESVFYCTKTDELGQADAGKR